MTAKLSSPDLCLMCGQPVPSTRRRLVCANCRQPIDATDRWTHDEWSRAVHRNCEQPKGGPSLRRPEQP